jgi:hypothetical protein
MPSATTKSPSLKKRKLPSAESGKKLTKRAKSPVGITKEEILELEQAIIESPKNYNKILTLQGHFQVSFLELRKGEYHGLNRNCN